MILPEFLIKQARTLVIHPSHFIQLVCRLTPL